MFGMFSVPWDFFHIGLLVIVIMIMIIGMVICVSVIGVCCFHWLASLDGSRDRGSRRRNNGNGNGQVDPSCPLHNRQYDNPNQAVHVVVVPEKLPKGAGGITMDPCQLREHFTRMEADVSQRRFLFQERTHQDHQLGMGSLPPPQPQQPPPPDDGPPPSYDMLYPNPTPTVGSGSTINTVAK